MTSDNVANSKQYSIIEFSIRAPNTNLNSFDSFQVLRNQAPLMYLRWNRQQQVFKSARRDIFARHFSFYLSAVSNGVEQVLSLNINSFVMTLNYKEIFERKI